MSITGDSYPALERSKRAVLRALTKTKADVLAATEENPSSELVQKIVSLLEVWKENLAKLDGIDMRLLEAIDEMENLSVDAINKLEDNITKDKIESERDFALARGQVYAMKERLQQSGVLRQSLNSSTVTTAEVTHHAGPKLPDIPVPRFDGAVTNFTEWYAMFNATIHNNTRLSDIQKLYFLRQAMVGRATDVLKDYPVSDDVYPEAYKHVEERFFNKRVIITNHFSEIVDLPVIQYTNIRESLDKVNAIIRGLKVCGVDTAKMSPMFTFLVTRKLPDRLRTEWETTNKDYSTYPSFEPLATFLSNRCFAYESAPKAISNAKASPSSSSSSTGKPKEKATLATVIAPTAAKPKPTPKCQLCDKDHYLARCPAFLEKSIADRTALVKEKNLCLNCFRYGHTSQVCRSSKCRSCGQTHNTALHDFSQPSDSNSAAKVVLTVAKPAYGIVLLPSAVVKVRTRNQEVLARVLLDSCSQSNLVSEHFVRKNRISSKHSRSKILGISQGLYSNEEVILSISSRFNDFSLTLNADVVGKIPYEVSPDIIAYVSLIRQNLNFADCDTDSRNVDIILGVEHVNRILSGNKQFIGELCIEDSQFGWVAAGPIEGAARVNSRCCHLSVTVKDILTSFWEVEEVTPPKVTNTEHELCEQHFSSTHARLPDGRFQVRLPFKNSVASLANTYAQAKNAMIRYESRLDPPTRKMYVQFMKEYCELGHMELAEFLPASTSKFYIPHLPVVRLDNTTTPLRVVFNASARNNSGLSLNQALLNGPVLQPDLLDCLLRFRLYPVAFSADITKMYRQIEVHPDDRKFQLVLWRNEVTEPLRAYQLTTLTYGTTPAAYIATKCLQIIAEDVKKLSPNIARAISSEFYMDNLLTGAETSAEATAKASSIHAALMTAQFPLRKYLSNSAEFLSRLEPSLLEPLRPVSFASSGATKMLGLQWHPVEDVLRIDAELSDITGVTLTKRTVSSLIASVFDPLGIASPVTIRGKILLQDLWREELAWDDPIPHEIQRRFNEYYADLVLLPQFAIPRWYSTHATQKMDIVGFCDASERAYGAVVYLRTRLNSEIRASLVCAKTKVAPIKTLTIPRLELLGAVLLVRLIERACKTINGCTIAQTRAFCDSTIVLAWLKNHNSKLEVFVRNRVELVNGKLLPEQWSYVKTTENPADLLTRGISVTSLAKSSLWSNGPVWLTEKFEKIECGPPPQSASPTRDACTLIACETKDESLLDRYSDYDKLVRVLCAALDFVFRIKPSLNRDESLNKTKRALLVLAKSSQHVWFNTEVASLLDGKPLPARSPLAALNPFLDPLGVIRVGGRLEHSALSYDTKHPVILHSKSKLAQLYTRHTHEKYFHASRAFTASHIRSRFWLIGGIEKLTKKTIYRCVWCTRMKGEAASQMMGDLPRDRTSISRPFTVSGVDFAGPFTIRCTNHRTSKHLKHYAAFFVCFSTRAVHIESVSDLSTNSFIDALKRFVARRGVPNTIWSDNGTNFVGARNLLTAQCDRLSMNWKFIPPRSPNHGGIWESAVKAGKKLFVAASKGTVLTEDQFKTALAEVEAILNSRPLFQSRKTNDPDVIDVLTPGHFLVGSHLLAPQHYDYGKVPDLKRLITYHQVITTFWQVWSKNYVAQLQRRAKWKLSQDNVKPGDIVLIKEASSPLNWPLAKVVGVTPDHRGKVRIIKLRVGSRDITRAVRQVVVLPIHQDR